MACFDAMSAKSINEQIESAVTLLGKAAETRQAGNEDSAAGLERAAQVYATVAVAEALRSIYIKMK